MKFSNFFLPHPDTHKKAHLISIQALVVYILLFIFLQAGFGVLNKVKPGVLGIAADISPQEIINLTNIQRQQKGLGPLSKNSKLDAAAAAKAQNMFDENYWAHYSPSGKDPWNFILGSGYKFTYAGENLAKNFYNPVDVVNAWMASPTHRDNLLNLHYSDIGIAVAEGTLNGQKTVLIVQEFGTPAAGEPVAQVPLNSEELRNTQLAGKSEDQIERNLESSPSLTPVVTKTIVAGVSEPGDVLDPFALTKNLALLILLMLFVLITLDLYILRRRAVIRLTSHHIPHLILISIATGLLIRMSPGSVL